MAGKPVSHPCGSVVPLADMKNRLSELVERLEREHGRVVITKHGTPAVVTLTLDDLESLEESVDILTRPALTEGIREAEDDIAAVVRRRCPGGVRSS